MTEVTNKRQVINIPGVSHGATPIPVAVRKGNMLYTSGIEPVDPETGRNGTTPEKQAELTFRHMREILESAGATPDDVTLVTVYMTDESYRPLVNKYWLEMFPDPENRPARKAIIVDKPASLFVQIQIVAVLS